MDRQCGPLKSWPLDAVMPCAAATMVVPSGGATTGQLLGRPSAISGFRRVYPGGATTGQQLGGHPPSPASVGFIPAGPQLVSNLAAIRHLRLRSVLSRRGHNWSATWRPSAISGFGRVYPGGATTGQQLGGHPPSPASVGFIPAGPQLVSNLLTWRPSAISGFRRFYPGGATTGQQLGGHPPSPASVGFIPAGPQLVSNLAAIRHLRLPSGLSRRGHNWSATWRPSAISGFGRVYPGGATTDQQLGGHPPSPASVGFIPAGPQLVSYRQAMTHRRSSPQRAIPPARLRDRIRPRPDSDWRSAVLPLDTRLGRVACVLVLGPEANRLVDVDSGKRCPTLQQCTGNTVLLIPHSALAGHSGRESQQSQTL